MRGLLGVTTLAFIVILFPTPVLAATCSGVATDSPRNLKDLVCVGIEYINWGLYGIMAIATITFVWYVYKYFFTADQDRKEAALYVTYSVVGFFIILSMWGLINLVRGTFKLDNSAIAPPTVGGNGASSSNGGNPYTSPGSVGGSAGGSFTSPGAVGGLPGAGIYR